jgi:peptidyl-prolyl cis-trans isomerase D
MFDWVNNNKRIIQIVLGLVLLPFAFFGVDSYFRGGDLGSEVARVGDYKISEIEFQQALRERQEVMRRMVKDTPLDQALLDSPEIRFATIEQIVRERLMLTQAVRDGLVVSDQQLRDVITGNENFREDGKFSRDRYENFLRAQNLSAAGFDARLRRELLQQPIISAIGENAFIPRTVADRIVRLSEQTREVELVTISPAAFVAQVKLDDAALKAYYDSRQREFELPEQARFDYVVLSLDNLAAQEQIPETEIRQVYDQNTARFATPEEREARHILIEVPAKATAEAKAAAKARAEELAKKARANPDQFDALARENSQDRGSAKDGGELGFLARGMTAKPFEDALFAMKVGEIAGPVQTDFGYHVIQLKSVRGGSAKPFEEVRATIESELKRARAARKFAELAEQFNNIAYEQSDSLKPVAEALKVKVQQSPWISRKPIPGSPLGGEKFLKAAFSEDVIKNKRNSEVVEIAPGTLISARLLEFRPAAMRKFDEVQAEIRKRLTEDEARKLAFADGRAKLEKLRKGEGLQLDWGKPLPVSRRNTGELSEIVLHEVFRADTTKVPAYAGAEDSDAGFRLIRISQVKEPETISPEGRQAAADQLKVVVGQELLADYFASLKSRASVRIKADVIEKK